MKKIIIALVFLISAIQSFGQSDDTTQYTFYRYLYGNRADRVWSNKVLRPPLDTTYTKYGLAIKNGVLYVGNGTSWSQVTGGGSSFDSSASQGGGFRTDPFNQGKYLQIKDSTSYATFKRLYKTMDSLSGVIAAAVSGKRDITDTSYSHFLATRDWLYKVRDSLFAVLNSSKVTNAGGTVFNYIGTYAGRPMSGSGLAVITDSSGRIATLNSGTVTWVTDPAGKTFNYYFRGKGQPGDTAYVFGRDSSFYVAAIRDSAGRAIHHRILPDSSWAWYNDFFDATHTGIVPSPGSSGHTKILWDDGWSVFSGGVDSTSTGFQRSLTNKRDLVRDDSINIASHQFKIYNNGNVYFGDTTRLTRDTIYVSGNSWGEGYYANPELPTATIPGPPFPDGFAYLTAAHYGASIVNLSISGSTAASALSAQLPSIPNGTGNWTNIRAIFLEFGINDMAGGIASYKTNYSAYIDSIKNRGCPANKIIVLSPGWTKVADSATRHQFSDTAIAIAKAKGCQYVVEYNAMVAGGMGQLMYLDSLHMNKNGHLYYSHTIFSKINLGTANVSIQGNLCLNCIDPRKTLDVRGNARISMSLEVDSIKLHRGGVSGNTLGGMLSGYSNTTGSSLTSWGLRTLYSNTTGSRNVAIGHWALNANTTANDNTAGGFLALTGATTGGKNSAWGSGAGSATTGGTDGTYIGYNAAASNANGIGITAVGSGACQSCTTNYVLALGAGAGGSFASSGGPGQIFIAAAPTLHWIWASPNNNIATYGNIGSIGASPTHAGTANHNFIGSVFTTNYIRIAKTPPGNRTDSILCKGGDTVRAQSLDSILKVIPSFSTGTTQTAGTANTTLSTTAYANNVQKLNPGTTITASGAYSLSNAAVFQYMGMIDASGGNLSITFTFSAAGQYLIVKRKDSSGNTVTVSPSTGNIDGSATATIPALGHMTLYWDGTNAWIIN